VGDQQRGHLGHAQAQAHAVAGDPGLGDLELGAADAVPVPDADLVVGQAVDGEVLAEPAVAEVIAAQVAGPVLVGLDLIGHHGALLAAVALQVALAVAVEVQPPRHHRPAHRMLPHAGVHGLALPRHVPGMPTFTDTSTGVPGPLSAVLAVVPGVTVMIACRRRTHRR